MGAAAQPPPSLASLSRRQRFCITDAEWPPSWYEDEYPPAAALPAGPWAASLRKLGAPYRALWHSGPLLAAAGQLEQLGVLEGGFSDAPNDASERFWRWCAAHPPLRQLHIEMQFPDCEKREGDPRVVWIPRAVHGLQRVRPALRVEWHSDTASFSDSFATAFE